MPHPQPANKPGKTATLLLYIFSGLVPALGALLFLLLLGAARSVAGYDMFFQLAGLGQLAPLVLRPLQAGLVNIAVLVLVLMLALAALLFAVARLASRQADLAQRVCALEEQVASLPPSVPSA